MNKNTLRITTGAMFVAIFAILLIINRQTGSMFEEFFLYLMPIPMVAYSAKYGLKHSVPVLLAMAFMSVIFGTPLTIFYAVTEAILGMVLGSCIFHKTDMTKTVMAVLSLSALFNVLNTIVFASFFGYDLEEEISQMQTMMTEVFTKAYANMAPEQLTMITNMLNADYLMRIMVISMIVMGLIQGFVIYQLSLLILRRLRFQVPKPGYLSMALFFIYPLMAANKSIDPKIIKAMETIFLCGYLYLVFFGFIAILLYMKANHFGGKLFGFIIGMMLMLMIPQILMVGGAFYIVGGLHQKLLNRYKGIQPQ